LLPAALSKIALNGSIKIIRRLKDSIDHLGLADGANGYDRSIVNGEKNVPLQKCKSNILLKSQKIKYSAQVGNFVRQHRPTNITTFLHFN